MSNPRANSVVRWAVLWRDDRGSAFMWNGTCPHLFTTRRAAREWIATSHGHIRKRKDLQAWPHNWRMPVPVKVDVVLRITKQKGTIYLTPSTL